MFVGVNRAAVFVVLPLVGAAACGGRADVAGDVDLRWLPRTKFGAGAPVVEKPAGDAVPFRDRNANGRYDAFIDPIGYCTPDGECTIPADRLTVHRLRRNGIAGSSAGVLLYAQRGGAEPADELDTLDLSLCTDRGTCSQPMQIPFEGVPEVDALWFCAEDAAALEVDTVSVAGGSPVKIPSHPHVRVVAEPRGDGAFGIRSSETIDRILVRLVQLDGGDVSRVEWSSGADERAVRLEGPADARLTLPVDALAACPDCAVMIQIVHVWRDDGLRDLSEAWLTLPLSEDGA